MLVTGFVALADSGSVFSPDWLSLALLAALLGYTAVVAWVATVVERERGHQCALCDADLDLCPRCSGLLRDAYTHERKDQP